MDLPTLDLALFLHGTETQKYEVACDIVRSFRKHGFVKLVNYGASEDFVQNIFRWVRLHRDKLVLRLQWLMYQF